MAGKAILVVFCLGCTAIAQDWPRFRGPNGSGVGTASHLPVTFGPENNVAWKTPTPLGHSSPVVVGRHVYITGFEGGTLLTLAYDRDTGHELWRRTVAPTRESKRHKLNNPASPSAAADADGVVVFFQDFGLLAYSADGEPAWEVPLEPLGNNHGMGSSPVLVGDLAIQVVAGDTGSRVLAFDRKTGGKRWEGSLRGVTYATPAVAEPAALVVVSTGEAIAFDPRDGKRLWWLQQIPYMPKSSPVVSPDGGVVFVSAQNVEEGMVRAMENFDKLLEMWDVNGDSKLTQAEFAERKGPADAFPQFDINGDGYFDREEHTELIGVSRRPHLMGAVPARVSGDATRKMIWEHHRSVPQVPSPLVYEGVYYAIREGGIVTSLDPETGALLKEGRIAPGFGPMFASPVAAEGKVYAISQAGQAAVLKAGREWEPLALNDLGEECFATPALSGDRIIVRTVAHLWCFRDAGPARATLR